MRANISFDASERKGDESQDDWYEQTFQNELSMITDIKSKSINAGSTSPLYDEKLVSLGMSQSMLSEAMRILSLRNLCSVEKRLEKISIERQALERRVIALDNLECLR